VTGELMVFAWLLALTAALAAGLLLFAVERVLLHVVRPLERTEDRARTTTGARPRNAAPVLRKLRRVWLAAIR